MDDRADLAERIIKMKAQERSLREALVVVNTSAKKSRQAIYDAQVFLAPLKRLLVTLECGPRAEDYAEARRLVASATKILDDALDALL